MFRLAMLLSENTNVEIQHVKGSNVAWIVYNPTVADQESNSGVQGQLVIQYDVGNDKKAGDIQVRYCNIFKSISKSYV